MVSTKSVLIIGSIARDHAVGWKLRQSSKVGQIYFAPGNGGTALIGSNTGIDPFDFDTLISFAKKNHIDLSICSGDNILAAGIVNQFRKNGLTIFGATKEAARIESSKTFAKDLMLEAGIPTARFKKFTDPVKAKKYIKNHVYPLVIKASGLALGKGVSIVGSIPDAEQVITGMMVEKVFGDSGTEIIIEEFMTGPEISIHVFADGKSLSLFPTSKDHKSIYNNNKGPNTGGMGTIAPVPGYGSEDLDKIKKTIVVPAINTLKARGIPFTGCLYPGLMMTKMGPMVVEFNSRFGDPEMESYMRILKTDAYDLFYAVATGSLSSIPVEWSGQFACCIVLASKGYPGSYKSGEIIYGLEEIEEERPGVIVFHFATKKQDGHFVTAGGRVLGVTAVGDTLEDALTLAYSAIGLKGIHFNGMQYRTDIGKIL